MQLSVVDAATRVGCSRKIIERLISNGQLRATNFGTKLRRIWRINEADLNNFLNGSTGVEAAKQALSQSQQQPATKPVWLGASSTRQGHNATS